MNLGLKLKFSNCGDHLITIKEIQQIKIHINKL